MADRPRLAPVPTAPVPPPPVPPGAWLATACASALFLGAAAGVWLLDGPWRDYLFLNSLNYALAALAFLGALHLGLALAATALGVRRHGFWWIYPFLPPAAGLAALAGFVNYVGLVIVFLGAFLASHVADLCAIRDGVAPPWYLRVRQALSVAALVWGGTLLVHVLPSGAG